MSITTTMPRPQKNSSTRAMRRACLGITTTGVTNPNATHHHIVNRGAGLFLKDRSRDHFSDYELRMSTSESKAALLASRLEELDRMTAKDNARRLAKPPKIKKGKKVRKPKK